MFEILAAGFIIGLTHAVPPGPITFEVLRRGVTGGFAEALKVDVGAVAADAVFFFIIAIGLAQVINDNRAKIIIWLVGCALLLFLGVRGIYNVAKGRKTQAAADHRETPSLLSGFLICITSPFAIMWWAGVFAGAMGASLIGSKTVDMALMFAGIALACLAWYAAIGLVGASGRRFIGEKWTKAMSLVCSIMMLLFAAILFYRGYVTIL